MTMTAEAFMKGGWMMGKNNQKKEKPKKRIVGSFFPPFGEMEQATPISTKSTSYSYQSQEPIPELFPKPFDVVGMQGKYIAYAEITIGDVTKEGLLFVRKCGAWKLIDPFTFLKGAGGSEGSIDTVDVKIHYMIYEEKKEIPHEKPRNKVKINTTAMDLDIIDMLGETG
jgi:hypothetical protein